ncbi:restriction endonuclease subunit S [Marinobacter maroccanus]|uniref:Restriction endonuclease subunit S n=1 Tax=Marinobacter maroccanus TaxID=2055143 RepID=A0A2S5ZDI1_9GAMM|nr:restriction endonuclease subunit S [Marinobacter maroccanus]PPI85358.1 restriction endonuclease subunit S [Marinobacter maroccanus]
MVRKGYKQTEVGEIPEDWDVKSVSDFVALLESGVSVNSVEVGDISGSECILKTSCVFKGEFKPEEAKAIAKRDIQRAKTTAKKNAIIVSRMNTPELVGEVGLVPDDFNNLFLPDRLWQTKYQRGVNVSPLWLSKCISYPPIAKKLKDNATGTSNSMKNISKNTFLELKVPAPKYCEQERIGQALNDVDVLIKNLEELIAKKWDIKNAMMQQLLTGKKRLPGFLGEWSKISMEKDAELNARIGWQALTTKEYLDSGDYFLVTGTDFIKGRINWNSCHFVDEWRYSQDRKIQLKEGDVLLTKDGTIGKVGYVDELSFPATLNSGVFVIRPRNDNFHPLFLFYILMSRVFDDFLSKITAGSTITHLYQKDFVTFDFYAPYLDEQREISKVLFNIDKDIEAHETKLGKVRALKEGMMQELLTGRTRIVDEP